MATSRISSTIKAPDGTALSGVAVVAMLQPSGGFRISDFTEVARIVRTTTNASGFWQLDLERNANVTPSNSWYEIVEDIPAANGGRRVWTIGVGDSDQSLLASLVTPAEQQPTVVPAGTVYLDQASADARYQALGSLGSSTPSTIDPDDAASAGVSTSASRQDHQHAIVAASASGLTNISANAEGVATSFSRSDHTHAITWNPPACRVFHSVAQSNPNLTEQALAFNSERYDTDSMHSTSVNTSRITFNTAGLYVVSGHGRFVAAANGVRQFGIRLNGTTYIATHLQIFPGAGVVVPMSVATTYKFAAADYVELVSFQDSGGAINVEAVSNTSPEFAAAWIGVG